MACGEHSLSDILAYLLALSLALAIAASPREARGGGLDTDFGPQPRWSNDVRGMPGVGTGTDCLARGYDDRPDYVPGIDAWGQPVVPAEPTIRPYAGPPVYGEIDVHLRQMQIGGRHVDLSGRVPVPIEPGRFMQGVPAASEDCFQPVK